MKKTYINPEIEIVNIKVQQHLLSMSGGSGQLSEETATEWGSRRGNFNFDEEDEY